MIQGNILQMIGSTPVVQLGRLAPAGRHVFVKLESFNPSGSVKDRMALAIIDEAERRGDLRPGQMVVEATSGNTGIAMAMVCAVRGYPFMAFISDNFSIERRRLIAAYGGRYTLVSGELRTSGRIETARRFARASGAYFSCQYENTDNTNCHQSTTGQEIIRAFKGRRFDWFVSGWGSGGTLTGVARAIRHARDDTRIAAAEPASARLLHGGAWHRHDIPGWAPDFVPDVLDPSVVDASVPIADEEAQHMARRMAREEGILCGPSAGGTVVAALRIAMEGAPGTVVVAMVPDTGERYLSTATFNEEVTVTA